MRLGVPINRTRYASSSHRIHVHPVRHGQETASGAPTGLAKASRGSMRMASSKSSITPAASNPLTRVLINQEWTRMISSQSVDFW